MRQKVTFLDTVCCKLGIHFSLNMKIEIQMVTITLSSVLPAIWPISKNDGNVKIAIIVAMANFS